MNPFKHLSLRGRFLIAPSIGVVLMLVLYSVSFLIEQSHTKLFQQLSDTNLPRIAELSSVTIELASIQTSLNTLLVSAAKDLDEERVYVDGKALLNQFYLVEDKATAYFSLQKTDQLDIHKALLSAFTEYKEAIQTAVELASVNADSASNELITANKKLHKLNVLFLDLSRSSIKKLTHNADSVNNTKGDQDFISILAILLIMLMLITAIYFSENLTSGLEKINQAMINLSSGQKVNNFPEKTEGYLKPLALAVEEFKKTLERSHDQQQKLKHNEERYSSLLNLTPTAIVAIDEEQNIILFNQAAEQLFGYGSDEIMGKPVTKLMPEKYHFQHHHNVENYSRPNQENEIMSGRAPVTGLRKNGEEFYMQANLSVMHQQGKIIRTAAITDISERLENEQKMHYQAHYDALTGVPNRFLSLDRLNHLVSESKRSKKLIAVLFVDLDNFKKINDSMGHIAGDKVLVAVSNRLKGLVREPDTVGRLGGDEFLVLLGDIDLVDAARRVAETIINSFRTPFIINDREVVVTLSLGVSIFPNDGDITSELLRKADSAMYRSKDLGKNSYTFFTEEMNQYLDRRLQIEEQLTGALDRGEFSIFYQPKIDLITDKIIGAEALLRWNNPLLGQVPPDEFIPLSEQIGAIVPIGEFVMEEALSVSAKWQNKYSIDFSMAVNISPRQFREHGLYETIINATNKHSIKTELFEIEITEGLLMNGDEQTANTLKHIGETGIGIGMDDFGTGYSSLSYLRNYPFTVLKIDRSFINDITTDPKDKDLVNAAIAMAHALKLTVVAEGIETKEQLTLLKEMGCDIGQGYYFNKPLPEEEFVKLFM